MYYSDFLNDFQMLPFKDLLRVILYFSLMLVEGPRSTIHKWALSPMISPGSQDVQSIWILFLTEFPSGSAPKAHSHRVSWRVCWPLHWILWMPWGENGIDEYLPLNLPWRTCLFILGYDAGYHIVSLWLVFLLVIFHGSISRAQTLTCRRRGCNQSSFLRCAEASTRVSNTHVRIPVIRKFPLKLLQWHSCQQSIHFVAVFFPWEHMHILILFPVLLV